MLPDVPFRFEENESSSTPQTHTPFLNERLQRESILVLDTRQLRTIGYIPFHDCCPYTQTDSGNSGSSGRRYSRERPLLPSRPSTHHAINLNRHVLPSPAHWDIRKQTVQLQPSSCPPQSAERSVSTTNTSIHKTPQKTTTSGRFGVTSVHTGNRNSFRKPQMSPFVSLSPLCISDSLQSYLLDAITGSSTTFLSLYRKIISAIVLIITRLPVIPILTASTCMSSHTASIWPRTVSSSINTTDFTPCVF